MRAATGARDDVDMEDDFARSSAGKMVIKDEKPAKKRKQRDDNGLGLDSDDSDMEDLKGFSGMKLALKGAQSVGLAPSIARSLGGKSLGGKSRGARSEGGKSKRGGSAMTGERFRAKKAGEISLHVCSCAGLAIADK